MLIKAAKDAASQSWSAIFRTATYTKYRHTKAITGARQGPFGKPRCPSRPISQNNKIATATKAITYGTSLKMIGSIVR